MPAQGSRTYDVVVFGATGFTGGLTAAELARRAPAGCRWAIAGRSRRRLEGVRAGLAADDPSLAELPVIVADVDDPGSMRDLAASTRVLITTVGPYLAYGDPVVAACAAEGTDYLDLTGEAEFVDRTWLSHHVTAEGTGARLVHAAGFDSIPHDLGVRFTVGHLPSDAPLDGARLRQGRRCVLGWVAGVGHGVPRPHRRRPPHRRRAPPGRGPSAPTGHARRGPMKEAGSWSLPFPSVDAQIVLRSSAVLGYGTGLTYSHNFVVGPMPMVPLALFGVATVGLLSQVPPIRNGISKLVPPGSGPSEKVAGPEPLRRAVRGLRRRPSGGRPRHRRRPRLHRDLEDAGRVGAVPGLRRAAGGRGPDHHGHRHGGGPHRSPPAGGHRVRGARGGSGVTEVADADEVVRYEVSDRVAVVTLNRPEARNAALGRGAAAPVGRRRAGRDRRRGRRGDPHRRRPGVLRGARPQGAGLGRHDRWRRLGGGSEIVDLTKAARPLPPRTKPLIGAVNGVAVTGGLELALACDFLVASEHARFADTHSRVGIQPGWGLTVALPAAVGVRRAKEMSATGNFVDAATALSWGLVNHVVAHGELMAAARRLALDIVSNDQAGVRRLLQTYDEGALGTRGRGRRARDPGEPGVAGHRPGRQPGRGRGPPPRHRRAGPHPGRLTPPKLVQLVSGVPTRGEPPFG